MTRRLALATVLLLIVAGCYGGGDSSDGSDSGNIAGTLSLRARWEQPDGSTGATLPAVVNTVRILVHSTPEDGEPTQCCLAVDPRTLPSSNGGRMLAIGGLVRGTAAVSIEGYNTTFAPAVAASDTQCVTVPAGVGQACRHADPASPAFRSATTSVTITPGINAMAPDLAVYAQPFVFAAAPAPNSSRVNPIEFDYIVADAVHAVDAASLALEVSDPSTRTLPLSKEACADGGSTPCSANGALGLRGFRIRTGEVAVGPGTVGARVQAASLTTPPRTLDFNYRFLAVNPATPTPTWTSTATPTFSPTSTATPTPTSTPTTTPTQTPSNTPTSTPTLTSTATATLTATQTPTRTPTPTITNTARPPREMALVTNSVDGTVAMIDTVSESVVATIPVGAFPVALAAVPSGRFVYVANSAANSVSIVDTKDRRVVRTISVGRLPAAVAASPRDNVVYVANSDDGTISVLDTADMETSTTITLGGRPLDVVFTPDGAQALVVNDSDGALGFIDTDTQALTTAIPVGAHPQAIALTPDGATAYVATAGAQSVAEVDVATQTTRAPIPMANIPGDLIVSPDGKTLYVLTPADGAIAVVDIARRERVATIAGFTRPAGAAFGLDGSVFYVTNRATAGLSIVNTATAGVRKVIAVGSSPVSVIVSLVPLD